MKNKILFPGSSDKKTAKLIAKKSNIEFGKVEIKTFACNEKYINLIGDIKDKIVYIYQTATQNPNDNIIELMLISNAAKLAGAKKIIAIIPNLPYSRQDHLSSKKHQEPISAKLIADLISSSGINKVITVHVHSSRILDFYKIETVNIETVDLFAKVLKEIIVKSKSSLSKYVIVSPDKGGIEQAKRLSISLGGLDFAYFEKVRALPNDRINISKMIRFFGDVKGKEAIIFDDMIDTCGTVINAKDNLMRMGAKKVILCATHPILSGSAIKNLRNANFSHIVTTNSTPLRKNYKWIKIISLADSIAEKI